jgi:hypothetical protein
MKRSNPKYALTLKLFKDPIPNSSKFVVGDWIIKSYGIRESDVAEVIGYKSSYYSGTYLIRFLDGDLLKTKQKYFRGPFKTKELALRFSNNPSLQETPDDLRLKPSAVLSSYKRLPETEKKLKEKFTAEPFNFVWLDTPVTIKSSDLVNVDITILAERKETIGINFKHTFRTQLLTDIKHSCIVRLNNSITKKPTTIDYSQYQIIHLSPLRSAISDLSSNLSPIELMTKRYILKRTSIKDDSQDDTMDTTYKNFNRLLTIDKLSTQDLIELCGNVKNENGKKILTTPGCLSNLKLEDKSYIREYELFPKTEFEFNDLQASNLNNCPKSAGSIVITKGDKLQTLSTNNNTVAERVEIQHAPLIKDLTGLSTFKDVQYISIKCRGSSNNLNNLKSLEGCPSDVSFSITINDNNSNLKTLKGLPDILRDLTVYGELKGFDCGNTTIKGRVQVFDKPETLTGLPKAESYYIKGYSQEEIENETRFGELKNKLPELDGIF